MENENKIFEEYSNRTQIKKLRILQIDEEFKAYSVV